MNSIFRDLQVQDVRLPSGLRVLVREDHSAPVVAIFTLVLAGYFDEPDESVGISHVIEHMFFKGTPTRGPGVIARQTKSFGGHLNASTIYDHTSYYTVLPSSALLEGLEIQSDALLHSAIDEEELRKELLVIVQEAKRKLDNPTAFAREKLYELMFDQHRMRRWRIGDEEQLRSFTRRDVTAFFERFYTAQSVVLVIVGDVDAQRAVELVAKYYADLREGTPKRDRGARAVDPREFRFREIAGDVIQAQIEIGWHSQPPLHEDAPYLDMLALILGQGRACHLYRNVRDNGLALGVAAYNYAPTELGVFGISVETQPADAEACIQAIRATVDAMRNGAISDQDVARAQSVLEARALRGMETMEGQATYLADFQVFGDWRYGGVHLDKVMSATRADVARVADRYLSIDTSSILCYRPNSAAPLNITPDRLGLHAR